MIDLELCNALFSAGSVSSPVSDIPPFPSVALPPPIPSIVSPRNASTNHKPSIEKPVSPGTIPCFASLPPYSVSLFYDIKLILWSLYLSVYFPHIVTKMSLFYPLL